MADAVRKELATSTRFTTFHGAFIAFKAPVEDTDPRHQQPLNAHSPEIVMTTHFDQACIDVSPTRFLRFADAAGTTVLCVEGCLWVTRDGSMNDILLSRGESFQIGERERVIVSGVEPSRARVSNPIRASTRAIRRPFVSCLRGWFGSMRPGQAPELAAG